MKKENNNNAPAGWYPDLEGNLRYWDGSAWLNIPAPPSNSAPAEKTTEALTLGADFRIEVGMSIFVGELNEVLEWPMTGDSVTEFSDLIIKDSNFANQIGLKNADSTQYGNPRLDSTHLNTYLWALAGVLFADYVEVGIEFSTSQKNKKLEWNTFRQDFRKAQRNVFSSPSFIENDKAPVDFYVNNLSHDNQVASPQRELVFQFLEKLKKSTSAPAIDGFLRYFAPEIENKEFLDESLIKFLWTEVLFSLPGLEGFDLESIESAITAVGSASNVFEWDEPDTLPWIIEHNRDTSNRISYNPWPWNSESTGLWNDDSDSFYPVERLEASQPRENDPSSEQKIAALSSLNLFGDENSALISENLNLFIEVNSDVIEECYELMADEWASNEEYSLPTKDEFQVDQKSSLVKKVNKVWAEYVSIIRED